MRRRLGRPRLATLLPWIAPLAAILLAVTFATTSTAGGTQHPIGVCDVSYRVVGTWSDGFQADLTLRHTGDVALSEWTLTWRNPSDVTIIQLHEGTLRASGTEVSVSSADLAPGAAVTIGFIATTERARGISGDPSDFRLNGVVCTHS